jgi:hypothetical protein
MLSYGILRRVAPVGTDVTEERTTSIIRVTRIGELRTTSAVTTNRSTVIRTYFQDVGVKRTFLIRVSLSSITGHEYHRSSLVLRIPSSCSRHGSINTRTLINWFNKDMDSPHCLAYRYPYLRATEL